MRKKNKNSLYIYENNINQSFLVKDNINKEEILMKCKCQYKNVGFVQYKDV